MSELKSPKLEKKDKNFSFGKQAKLTKTSSANAS